MSDRKRDREKSKAVKGATLFSSKSKKRKKKRTWKKSDARDYGQTIYNRASDPHHEKQLINYLEKNGIEVKQYKDRYIFRRLRVRMGRLKFNSYKDYLDYIRKNPTELAEIQESLSINVTRFFRNRDTYDMVRTKILPLLAKKKKSLKFWSAGCAVGAEPYSMAMIASDAVPNSVRVNILATDVKEELLRAARSGIYSKPYLAELHASEISKYFLEDTNGDYRVKPHIKNKVNFRQQDLMKDDFPRNIDMVFCRNVLIYVDRTAQNHILNKFFKALKPGGFLVLGRTETLFGDWRKSVNIISTKHRVYQKKEAGTFEEIEMQDPVSNLMGGTFTRLENARQRKVEAKQSEKSRRRTGKPQKITSERVQELKDFRKTFEERKRMWEERMEENRKQRKLRMTKMQRRSESRSRLSTSSRRSRKSDSPTRFSSKPSTEPEDTSDLSLSDYRKLLKRSTQPIRESRVRKDLDDDK